MGIDVYLRWKGQSKDEADAQITGFSTTSGAKGYLREAYHGGPYVTHYFVNEAFEDRGQDDPNGGWVKIPAKTLKERLPAAITIAMFRDATVYGGKNPAEPIPLKGEIKEGELPDEMIPRLTSIFKDIAAMKAGYTGENLLAERVFSSPELVKAANEAIEARKLPDFVLSYVDFAALAEEKEKQTGEPVEVYASY